MIVPSKLEIKCKTGMYLSLDLVVIPSSLILSVKTREGVCVWNGVKVYHFGAKEEVVMGVRTDGRLLQM